MRTRPKGDDGASLMIVLVFMILISVVSLSLLDLTQASYGGTDAVRVARQENNAADAAVELAIRRVSADPLGKLGTGTGPACSFSLLGVAGVPDTSVRCAPDGTAGAPGSSARPGNALLALTGDITVTGNQPLDIEGDVYTVGAITAGQSQNIVTVNGALTALGGGECSSSQFIATPKYCTASPTPPTALRGVDPGWSPVSTSIAATSTVPVCGQTPGGIKYARFLGGKYTSSPASLLSSPGCASRKVLYFPDPTYYFEDTVFNTGAYDVVAGSAPSGLGSWLTDPLVTSMPSGRACDPNTAGTQFLLGGSAQLTVPNQTSTLSFCAGPDGTTQPAIAIYGSKTARGGLKALTAGTTAVSSFENKPSLFVQGAIYLPTSSVAFQLHNKSQTELSGGVVVGSLALDISASSTQLTSPISLPACTSNCRSNRRVVVTASIGGRDRLRAVVDFDDSRAASPASPYTVASWNVLP